MRISRLLMPAVTLAGALALAGCGGGSGTPANPGLGGDDKFCPAPNQTLTYTDSVDECPGSPEGRSSGTPLEGDALAEAEAIMDALVNYTANNLIVDVGSPGTADKVQTNIAMTSKLGTPIVADGEKKWSDASSIALAVGGGWTAKGYERETDDVKEYVVSYSSGERVIDQPLSAWIAATSGISPNDGDTEVLDLPTNPQSADRFQSNFHTQERDDDGELKGTFVGLPGTFKCDGDTCAVTRTVTGDSAMITLAGTWTFEPDGDFGSLKVPAKYGTAANPKFLTFGYWWSEEEDEDDLTVKADAFAAGAIALTELPGGDGGDDNHAPLSASYSGKASGVYVREVLDGSEKAPAAAGQFSADVTLSAVFTGDTGSTISGSIHDFKDGTTQISDWKLALEGDVLTSTGAFDGKAGTEGTYRGSFYGMDGEDDEAPPGAAGVFNSGTSFANGHAAGAFGATVDED